jgi:hypothetical protein
VSDRASNTPRRPVRRPIESGAQPVHQIARAKDPQRSRITKSVGIIARGRWPQRLGEAREGLARVAHGRLGGRGQRERS